MAKYLVTLQYDIPKYCTFVVEADSESEAETAAFALDSEGVGTWEEGDNPSETYVAESHKAENEEVAFVEQVLADFDRPERSPKP